MCSSQVLFTFDVSSQTFLDTLAFAGLSGGFTGECARFQYCESLGKLKICYAWLYELLQVVSTCEMCAYTIIVTSCPVRE